jgi:hypothetical protein
MLLGLETKRKLHGRVNNPTTKPTVGRPRKAAAAVKCGPHKATEEGQHVRSHTARGTYFIDISIVNKSLVSHTLNFQKEFLKEKHPKTSRSTRQNRRSYDF